MVQDKYIQQMILDDTGPIALDAWQPLPPIRTDSVLTAALENERKRTRKLSAVASAGSAGVLVLLALNFWLKKAVTLVASTIRGFWNLITSILKRKSTTSPRSYQEDTLGLLKSYDGKSANAVYSVQTATGNTPLNNSPTIPTMTSEPHSTPSTPITISPSDYVTIRDALVAGTLDYSSITLEQFLEVSFLALFEGFEIHNELRVVHKGNLYQLHACLSAVVPGQSVKALNTRQ